MMTGLLLSAVKQARYASELQVRASRRGLEMASCAGETQNKHLDD